jgi:HSP20 family protein
MTLAWPVLKELLALRERLNELFDEALLDKTLGVGEPTRGPFCPAGDLYETDDEIVVILELPGIDGRSVDLQLNGDRLRVSGHIAGPGDGDEGTYVRMERPRGAFYRDFQLPLAELSGSPSAELERGVLTVRLPKAGGTGRRRVAVAESGQ